MTTIAHRELRNNSSDILRRAQQGESFEITNHGEVVAVLGTAGRALSRPVASRKARGGRFSDLERVELGHPIRDALDYLRGDA